MSRKYKHGDIVPTDVLADRLGVLAQYIADGIDNRKSHFYMSIPAELDRDADLVMSTTAGRLREYEDEIAKLKAQDKAQKADIRDWMNEGQRQQKIATEAYAEIARLKTSMRVLAKCSDEDIAKLKEMLNEAAEVFKRIGMTEQEIIMLIKLREAAK